MYTSINGELCKIDKAYSGEIVILQNEFLKLNSVLGDTKLLPQRKKIENPHPLLQTTVEPSKPEQREMLLDALLEISDSDPLLRYYVDSTTHEIILSFLGKVQMEVISALLQEKYHVEIELKEPTVIYMERPLKMQNIPFTSKCRQILSGLPLVYLYHRFRWEVECSMRARFLLDT